jgi:hypothetical protein
MRAMLLGLVVAAVCALTPALEAREGPDVEAAQRARAEELFREGRDLMKAGSITDACIKFQQSLQAFESVGAALNLGQCHEFSGHFASAVRAYELAEKLAAASSDAERAAAARRFADAARAKVSRISIRMEDPGAGTVVMLDDVALDAAALSQPQPVDPGDHRIVVQGPNGPRWSTSLHIGGNAETRVVDIPVLPAGEGEVDGGGGGGLGTMQTAGIVLLATAGVAGVVGAVFGGLAVSGKSDTDELCPEKLCSGEGSDALDDTKTKANVSTAMFVIGGAALVAGIVLVAVDGGGDGEEAALRIVPLAGWDAAGVLVQGRF